MRLKSCGVMTLNLSYSYIIRRSPRSSNEGTIGYALRKNGHGSRSSARLAWFRRGSNRPVRPARDVGFTAAASLLRVLRTRLVSSALLSPMPRDSKNHEKPSRHPHETSRLALLKGGDDLLLGWPAVLREERLLSSAPDRGAALRHADLDGVGVYPVGDDFRMLVHLANGVARRVVLLLPAVSVAAVGDHVRVLVHGGARVGWGVVHDVNEPVGSPPARRSCDTRENVGAADDSEPRLSPAKARQCSSEVHPAT